MSSKDLLKLSFGLILVASAGTAYASVTITTTSAIGTSSFSPSANVTISVASGTSAYSAYSQHLSGNRGYWGNNSDPKLYYGTRTAGSTSGYSPASGDSAPSGWSSL